MQAHAATLRCSPQDRDIAHLLEKWGVGTQRPKGRAGVGRLQAEQW